MLQDVQERLVYRTLVYIRSDILGYNAAAGDLAYPDKLEMMQNIAETLAGTAPLSRSSSRYVEGSTVSCFGRMPSDDLIEFAPCYGEFDLTTTTFCLQRLARVRKRDLARG